MSITWYYAEACELARNKKHRSQTYGNFRDLPSVLADTSSWWREQAVRSLQRQLTLAEKQEFYRYCYQQVTPREQASPLWQDFYSQAVANEEPFPMTTITQTTINPSRVLIDLLYQFPELDQAVRKLISEKYLHQDLSNYAGFTLRLLEADCEQPVECETIMSIGLICRAIAENNRGSNEYEFANYRISQSKSGLFILYDLSYAPPVFVGTNVSAESLITIFADPQRIYEWWEQHNGD